MLQLPSESTGLFYVVSFALAGRVGAVPRLRASIAWRAGDASQDFLIVIISLQLAMPQNCQFISFATSPSNRGGWC
ncbi:hypothetical protein BKA70DRAFT_1255127 [Coprinopsis sp. MPI-PUGE-AT-0042]|nr:hypothetical protein BKA70DRAFT_1255127 [Coprinopsis sp. MPI-PUGE-AT-0042]